MKHFLTCLAAMAGQALIAQPAIAQTSGSQCTTERPCAEPFLENGLYGVRNGAGEVTIPPKFTNAYMATERYPESIASGLIITEIDGKSGFVNHMGVEQTRPEYTIVADADNGNFVVTKYGKACVININAALIVQCIYDKIESYADHGHFMARRNNKVCVINQYGNVIVECKFDRVETTDRAYTFLVTENGRSRHFTPFGPGSQRSAQPAAPTVTRAALEQLVAAKKWDQAIRAVKAGKAEDVRYVLLTFSRTASSADERYMPGLKAMYEDLELFKTAIWISGPVETSELQRLERHVWNWTQGPLQITPGAGGRINARTVGECLSAGGTVTVMNSCVR